MVGLPPVAVHVDDDCGLQYRTQILYRSIPIDYAHCTINLGNRGFFCDASWFPSYGESLGFLSA